MTRACTWILTLAMGLTVGAGAPLRAQEQTVEPKVVAGEPTSAPRRPYNVSLQLRGVGHFCGGSIIQEDRVLTAAHCLSDFAVRPSEVTVVAGVTRLTEAGQQRRVLEFAIHPSYRDVERGRDVAVLLLDEPFDFNDRVRPIAYALARDRQLERPDTPLTVVGFGATREDGPISSVLMEATVPAVRRADARRALGVRLNGTHLAAGGRAQDACQGDSGSPLIGSLADGTLVQVGIVSFGIGCGRNGLPGIYGRVSAFAGFIRRNAGQPVRAAMRSENLPAEPAASSLEEVPAP